MSDFSRGPIFHGTAYARDGLPLLRPYAPRRPTFIRRLTKALAVALGLYLALFILAGVA